MVADRASLLSPDPHPSPRHPARPTALDLFAGCGGLALGFEAAGFATVGYEMDADPCASYRSNLNAPCHEVLEVPAVPRRIVFDGAAEGPRLVARVPAS